MTLPADGSSADDVLARLEDLRSADVAWRDGRAFSLAYFAGDEVLDVQQRAYAMFMGDNALNTDAFPSLRAIQADVVDVARRWLGGDDRASGFMTSGGTESILLAVLAARQRGRAERDIDAPEMVLPTSAHAAFEKAAHYFGVRSVRVPVGADWRADVAAMAEAVNHNTVLIVGSAPQYPQGVIDPIVDIAALAADRQIACHVDACMGGVTLAYLPRLGYDIAPWNFAVDGVTSMSVDLHKFGYTAKGASVVMYRDKRLRSYQTFVTDNWLGGMYGSSGMAGTKSGGSMAAAWAVFHHLGDAGYLRLTAAARRATEALARAVDEIDGLSLRAEPDTTLVAFGADGDTVDVNAVADELWRRRWYLDRQGPPPSLHCTVNAVHDGLIAEFAADLADAVSLARHTGTQGGQRAYGTVE